MDPHTIAKPEFWADDASLMMEAGQAHAIAGLPVPSVVFATSGSTGEPRRVVLSKESLLISARAVNDHLHVDAESVWGLCLPWWHVGGFGVLARAHAAQGAVCVAPPRWDVSSLVPWLAEQGVTHLSLVPTQVHDLVRVGARAPHSLRAVVVGGGRLEPGTGRAARALGWPLLASYGMTEAGSQIATQALDALEHEYACGSLVILPCWQVRGVEGRLHICGEALFHGEMIRKEKAWRYVARQGDWYATQDCGEVREGSLRVSHRADALVKVLGELVNPLEIESQLADAGLPVGRFAVLALADERKEHRLCLVHENVDANCVAVALAAYHGRCPGFARLDEERGVVTLPRSDLGKIRRAALPGMLAP
jgi:o-succinylbenzoate---CoA ligase